MNFKAIALILCGGRGTRLWPVTGGESKQFFKLKSGKTLLHWTVARFEIMPLKLGLVLNFSQVQAAKELLGKNLDYLIVEPFTKNTAPAIAFAVLELLKNHTAETVVLFAPCDQVVDDEKVFFASLQTALQLAECGKIILLGFLPDRPDPSLGYFLPDTATQTVKIFIEKPDLPQAQQLLSEGFVANAGIFVGQLGTFLQALQLHCPQLLAQLQDFKRTEAEISSITAISFDHAVLQKSNNVGFVVTPCKITDVGKVETFLKHEEFL